MTCPKCGADGAATITVEPHKGRSHKQRIQSKAYTLTACERCTTTAIEAGRPQHAAEIMDFCTAMEIFGR